MLLSLKKILASTLFLMCMVQLNAQYATGDFNSTNLISDGLNAPGRMAIDSNDDIYVIDAINKHIVKYDVEGNSLGTIDTEFIPLSVAIDHEDRLFAGDETTGPPVSTCHSLVPVAASKAYRLPSLEPI